MIWINSKTKKKTFTKNTWYNWYDWLIKYIPNPIKKSAGDVKDLITQLIAIAIAPYTVLFCNCPLVDLYLTAVKSY